MIKEFRDVDDLSSADFEIFVKDLFESSGWSGSVITKTGQEYKHGDGGVDIFAYKSGRKFAIEVKQRNINNAVDIKALNQLVTGSRLENVTNMILVTNSYFTSEVKVRALRLGVELIDRDELQNLWVKRHSEIGRDIKPRKYQVSVINESIEKYKSGKRKILIEMATGLGKTYTVALIIKELIGELDRPPRVLFIAHQIEILLQSVTAFKNVLGVGNYSFSACFSGAYAEDTDFVFATFDTLYGQINKMGSGRFDFVVVDEAHHTPANTYSQVVRRFEPDLLIGLTATPYRNDGRSVTEYFGGEDGHIGKYDIVWGLQNGKLAYPKYMVLLDDLDESKISQLDMGLSVSDLDKRLFLHKKDEEIVRIIQETITNKKIDHVKGIVFCRSIRHMKHLIGFFEMGTAILVHSKMRDQERRDNIRSFREGEYKFVLVCDLFNEGVDIPEANLLVFMRYTGSRNVWLQQLGRGLRKTPNKEYVHVLDFVGSLERLNEIKMFADSVREKEVNLEELDVDDVDEMHRRSESFHDSSIEVTYSKSAAKVLDLIESLRYRLKSREMLIERIVRYSESIGKIPSIEEIEKSLPDISLDQISTHFDSYHGYIFSAFGASISSNDIARIEKYYAEYFGDYGVAPSVKAISLHFKYKCLQEFTENEILKAGFLRDLKKEDLQSPLSFSFNESGNSDCCALLERYKNKVNSRYDLKLLSTPEVDAIVQVYGSVSAFLVSLKKYVKTR